MNVLITGANGFVGHALCAGLVNQDWSIRGVIRSGKHVARLPAGIDIVQIESIGPDTDWSQALENIETVVHLASRVHFIEEMADDPLSAFRYVNTAGSEHLARAAAKAGVRRLVYVSSIKVNGERTISAPFTEHDEPAPEDPYAVSKWEAEQVLKRISSETGLEIVVVRPPLVYGPGVKGNFLRLMQWVDKGIPLPLSMVRNRRSLIGLDNFVDVLVQCVQHPRASGQTFLVADDVNLSTPELLKHVAEALGRRVKLFPFPPPLLRLGAKLLGMGDISNRLCGSLVVDSSKVNNLLNWHPPVSVRDGLQQTARWYLSKH